MNNLFKNFTVSDNFFGRYEKLIKDIVIPYQEKALKDEIPDIEKSHAIANFRTAAKMLKTGGIDEEFYGMVFQDSDVAKWLEAAAYSLLMFPDKELEKRCDEIIDLIGEAQHEDGYLNTYFTVKMPGKRWTNLAEAHELYCAGHMMEAAAAYAQCTGKTKLLDIMSRMTEHIYNHFINNRAEGYPGHPEIEIALIRMYDYTQDKKYLKLAGHFIDCRGVNSDYFIQESKKKGWYVWGPNSGDKEYAQCQSPVREQKKAMGHAVRAVYLYTGMAAYAAITDDETLKNACETLWENITQQQMYITSAIGSAYEGEAFTKDYHLPNDTAYAETCAAIGLIFFASKMIDINKDSKYADVMEKALYNCVLAGMQLDGTRFFYVNPLEVIPGITGKAQTHRHTLPERPKWFACACCPPNVARLLSSIGGYAWSMENGTVYSHLFIGGTLDLSDTLGGKIKVETSYPYNGEVKYNFMPDNKEMHFTLGVRIPFWSENFEIMKNDEKADYILKNGYAYISGTFSENDIVVLSLDMSVKRVFASVNISANNGKVTFSRGPFIYCAEGADNGGDVLGLYVKKDSEAVIGEYDPEKLEGIVEITLDAYRVKSEDMLYSFKRPQAENCKLKLVPYYAWGNRGINQMRVWIPEF